MRRLNPQPLTWTEAALLACLHPTAGYTRKAANELRSGDLVEEEGGAVYSRAAWTGTHIPIDVRAEVLDAWINKLAGPADRFLRIIADDVGPHTRSSVSQAAGLSETAGYTRKGWKTLRSTQLIEDDGHGRIQLNEVFRDLARIQRR